MSAPTGREIADHKILLRTIFGDDPQVDTADLDENPFPEMILKNQVAAVRKSAGGTSVILDLPVPGDDDVDVDGEFWKAPVVVLHNSAAPSPEAFTKADRTPNTLATKLGITRTEEITAASGDVWIHAYNAAGELVHARLLQCADD